MATEQSYLCILICCFKGILVFQLFSKESGQYVLYGMWYFPTGGLYKTSQMDGTQTGGWCSWEPIGEAISVEADAETNIPQSVSLQLHCMNLPF